MEQPQKLYLPRILILDSDHMVHQMRQDLELNEAMNPGETERTIIECISNSIQIAPAAQVELQYNCHYLLPEELPELFYFDTEKKAEKLIRFGMELLRLAELSRLFSRQGQLLYEFQRVLGSSIVLNRVDVDTCELNTHEWTKGYEREWTRPEMVAGLHHPQLQASCRPVLAGGAEVFGIRWA